MFQGRQVSRPESLLRFPQDGASNLAQHAGGWYVAGPSRSDEIWRVSGLNLIVAGPGLLRNLAQFGDSGAALELGFDLHDGYGVLRDHAPLTSHLISVAKDWNAGQHTRTVVNPQAGAYSDGAPRAGLCGNPALSAQGPASWTSVVNDLRYGTEITAACWEGEALRNDLGVPLDKGRLVLSTGTRNAQGQINWNQPTVVAQTGPELEAGSKDFQSPLTGDVFQWAVELPYGSPAEIAYDSVAQRRTPTMFLLGVWIRLKSTWWRIESLADLLLRSEANRELIAAGWNGNHDALMLRLPVSLDLRGRKTERLRTE